LSIQNLKIPAKRTGEEHKVYSEYCGVLISIIDRWGCSICFIHHQIFDGQVYVSMETLAELMENYEKPFFVWTDLKWLENVPSTRLCCCTYYTMHKNQ
jgi:hypothetical protein